MDSYYNPYYNSDEDKDENKNDTIINLVIVGDGGSGKTAWIRALQGCKEFEIKYIPTYTPTDEKILHTTFTSDGEKTVVIRTIDRSGQEKFGDRFENYKYMDCAIVFFDSQYECNSKSIDWWIKDIRSSPDLPPLFPIVVVGNKVDLSSTISSADQIHITSWGEEYPLFYISVKTGENIDGPLSYLVDKLIPV